MNYCEACGGWTNATVDEHQRLLHFVEHLRLDHGLSRRRTARRAGVDERYVKRHVDEATE